MTTGRDEEAAIRFEDVTKRYGAVVAVDSVSLKVEPGEIFALLGPNGAGKTTMISCASGLIHNFSGRISIGGFDVRRDYRVTRSLVGLVPQELNFDGFFTARQALFYQTGYFGKRPDPKQIEQILRDFALIEKADTNTRQLSGGMKRRLMICKALVHEPALLFLDEPTAGVDVSLREELWSYVLKLKEQGVTIVLTTHYLQEAERLADRIGIINHGKILREQAREDLLAELGRRWLEVSCSGAVDVEDWKDIDHGSPEAVGENALRFDFDSDDGDGEGEHLIGRIVDRARERGLRVVDVSAGRSTLEQVFKDLVLSSDRREEGGGS